MSLKYNKKSLILWNLLIKKSKNRIEKLRILTEALEFFPKNFDLWFEFINL